MIAQNPIFKSVVVVVTFWYTTLFALSGLYDVPVWHVVYLFPVSMLISCAGCLVGILWMVAVYRKSQGVTGQELRAGSRIRQASFSLGCLPPIDLPKQVKRDDLGLLAGLPWWEPIQRRAPPYAAAIRAVLRIMSTTPRFPASPVPGGHGGRTLIEHSVAVAGQMLREASTWVYTGQKDKHGNLRVPLQSGRPHRFQSEDGPLLVLTGLAHDIGKMVCWDALPGQDASDKHGPPLHVSERLKMHDSEGARLLRRVPEIMALPLRDRTALLSAINYYHHPMAMPMAPWVTDKVRSLTELLIKADIATGKQEGHVLTDSDPDAEYGQTDESASAPNTDTADTQEEAEETRLHVILSQNQEEQRKAMQQGDYEFRLLESALHKHGAVNDKFNHQRIAWKRGEWIYVMDAIARRIIANSPEVKDPIWAASAFDDVNGNASPFTKAVLQQLDARGALLTELDGKHYPPTRALFNLQVKEGSRPIAVFAVKSALFPELYAPEAPNQYVFKLTGPFWGKHTARQGEASGSRDQGSEGADNGMIPEDAKLTQPLPATNAPVIEAAGMDDVDFSPR